MKIGHSTWPVLSLFDFCSPKQWPTIPQSALVEHGYPVYGANGKIGYYTEFNYEKATVLITCRGATCGTINVCEPKSYVTGNAMALDDLDETRVSANYLVYALRNGSLAQAISGTAQPQITRQSLTAISIALPPLAEQRRIAEILDRAEALRAKRRAALSQLDSLTRSIFVELFGNPVANVKGWLKVQLREVCDNITDGTHETPTRVQVGVPFITSKNIRPFEFDLSDLDFVSSETHQEIIKRCNPRRGDVLYTNIGVNVGNAVANRMSFGFSLKNVALIQPDFEKLDSSFLESLLTLVRSKNQF